MLYCAKCQFLTDGGAECPSCGSRKLREVRPDDPVLLLSAGEPGCGAALAALDEVGIPHEERMCGTGAPSALLYGRSPGARYRVFVPFRELTRCRELMEFIGVPLEPGKAGPQVPPDAEKKTERQWGRTGRFLVRILSAVFFLLLVWAVVALTDGLIALIKSALR